MFEPNSRGSHNLGNTFQAPIWNDARVGPGRDVMSGVDLLIQRGLADPKRMAVSGWSYGGYMTAWLLGNYPDRWRAGVGGAAVTDPIDQYVLSDVHSVVATDYGGSPFASPERLQAYRDQAPLSHATRIKAPTLVLCDTGDQRVPISPHPRISPSDPVSLSGPMSQPQVTAKPLTGPEVVPASARILGPEWGCWRSVGTQGVTSHHLFRKVLT